MEKPGLRHFCAGDVAKRSAGVLPCGPAPRRPALDGVDARTFVLICMKLEKSYSQLSKRFGLEGVFPTGKLLLKIRKGIFALCSKLIEIILGGTLTTQIELCTQTHTFAGSQVALRVCGSI
jgi:hypothetical protein